ncbi:hypothetical protein LPJ73_002136 [Coemansia sp. RSA 2703]|nr:hypothetical protein LPJ73_002136 [Coemansia sp. RSA 2703]
MDMEPQTMFASAQAEDEYVRRQVDLRKYMTLLVEAGFLTAATRIRLAARESQAIVVTLYAADTTDAAAAARRLDANLFFRLVERPTDLAAFAGDGAVASMGAMGQSYQLPVRRFLMQATLRRTELEVGQKSINVGNMQVGEACRKYLVIQNRSAAAAMYAIRKTGSIASGDIRFVEGSRYGVVRAFDSRKIVFVFQPALHGVYSEQIAIGNVLDEAGGKTATLKAVVRRPSKFFIQSLGLDFGVVRAGVAARHNTGRLLVVRNMTDKKRVLAVRAADMGDCGGDGDGGEADMDAEVQLHVEFPADGEFAAAAAAATHGSGGGTDNVGGSVGGGSSSGGMRVLDRDAEEKIESLEQKIKIAVRKNYPDKVEKYRAKIAKLRGISIGAGGSGGGSGGGGAGGEQGGSADGGGEGGGAVAAIERMADDTELVVTLGAHGEVAIPVAVSAVAGAGAGAGAGGGSRRLRGRAQVVVHEVKDKDNVKVVGVVAEVAAECV